MIHYREFPARRPLSHLVECFWVLEEPVVGGDRPIERVLPDGRIEIIVHYGDRFRRIIEGTAQIQSRSLVVGPITAAVSLQATGVTGMVGCRLFPHAAPALLQHSGRELQEVIEPLESLWSRCARSIEERVCEATSDEQRIEILEHALLRRLCEGTGQHSAVEHAVKILLRSNGTIPIERLARSAGLGRRQLERNFGDIVGLSPKLLARIIRFSALVAALESREDRASLSSLALNFGYYDQPHLNRDFRRFAGVTPTVYLRELNRMSREFLQREP